MEDVGNRINEMSVLWKYLNQKIFDRQSAIILNPFKFRQIYKNQFAQDIQKLERCWEQNHVDFLEKCWKQEHNTEEHHNN